MEYLLVKVIHIISATLLFGTGLGSAFYRWMADRSGDLPTMMQTNRMVVIADWCFTTPAVIIQPITGFWLLHLMGIPLTQTWVVAAILLYLVAGLCWLPVVWLQIRLRDLVTEAVQQQKPLDEAYNHYARIWFWLGVPAFSAVVNIFFLMVFKPA